MNNLAGIVPIAGHSSDMKFPWHHAMMPYDKDKTLVQNAVYTCAIAGCKSIWLVCNHDIQPIIKSLVGDSIEDPVYKFRSHSKYAGEHKRRIPIFYVPLSPRDLRNKNNISWSAIFGCMTAKKIFGQISTYTAPDRYFVSWPYAILNNSSLRQHRKTISKKSLIFSSAGSSVATNDFLPFCFSNLELDELYAHCYKLNNPYVDAVPFSELSISDVFYPLLDNETLEADLRYRRVSSWDDYCRIFK
tara:strand:- start:437 stop:1171 length:735 start_codon:yes stop_codon:yes gene_type:complete